MDNHPLRELSERYLSEKAFSKATLKAYRIAYKHYIRSLEEHGILHAKTSDVIRYRDERRRLGYSSHYIHVHISALRGFYTYLRQNQERLGLPVVYAQDIMAPIQNERCRRVLRKPILTLAEVRRLLQSTKELRHQLWQYRDHAIVYVMIVTGLRGIEIVRAKRRDYQWRHGGRILVVPATRTGHRTSFVHIEGGVKDALDAYLARRKDDNPHLFISHKKVAGDGRLSRTFFRAMFARVLRESGLEETGITPHSLRHTAAILNLERGGTIEQTQSLLRHVDLQSTMVYVDYLERMNDDSEGAIERLLLKEAPRFDSQGDVMVELIDGPRFVWLCCGEDDLSSDPFATNQTIKYLW
jgi:site-specific recombinase XerD